VVRKIVKLALPTRQRREAGELVAAA
jgi:hypothetical protein